MSGKRTSLDNVEVPEAKIPKLDNKDEVNNKEEEKKPGNYRTKKWQDKPKVVNPIVEEEPTPPVRDLPKRKYALYIGFCGIGYQGMQINPGANSIELHLHRALYKAGAIDPRNMERLQKISWMRCARTDKGVHAVGQIVSAKLMFNKEVLDATNEYLPDDIRIFDFVQVTGGFDSKNSCEARTYEYTLRTEVLRPSKKHPKFSERDSWVFDESEQSRFNELIQKYVGTHKYHNFTKGGSPSTASCTRYIMKMTLSKPFSVEGMEFVRITLKGQSFILHQIRKMVASAAIIFRDGASPKVLDKFMGNITIILPMVPGLGLILLKCHFDKYQRTKGKDREPLTFEHHEEAVSKFREEQIYSQIYKIEREQDVTMDWLTNIEDSEIAFDYDSEELKCN